mmetsp:Transcript_93570/g.185642  ORF Transcript_93570/g.185642 Transcript_93570/m.185642 type:complete len:220 (-) Transcript_93570:1360-2019(-)
MNFALRRDTGLRKSILERILLFMPWLWLRTASNSARGMDIPVGPFSKISQRRLTCWSVNLPLSKREKKSRNDSQVISSLTLHSMSHNFCGLQSWFLRSAMSKGITSSKKLFCRVVSLDFIEAMPSTSSCNSGSTAREGKGGISEPRVCMSITSTSALLALLPATLLNLTACRHMPMLTSGKMLPKVGKAIANNVVTTAAADCFGRARTPAVASCIQASA